jgi:hypothetical protein
VPLSNFVPRGFGFVHHSIAFSITKCQTLISRFATFSSQYEERREHPPAARSPSRKSKGGKATAQSAATQSIRCVCMCVCVRERERERERSLGG